jgi:hypothetical protein
MKIVNRISQTSAIIATLHQNPQKVVWKESGINAQEMAKTGNLAGKTWTSNVPANQAVQHIQPPEISRSLLEVEDRLKNDMREIVGVTEAYTGQSVGSLTTSTGVNSLIERSSVRDKDKMIQIDDFVERVSYLIILNVMYNWDRVRPIMTLEKNGEPRYDLYEPLDSITMDNLEIRVRSNVYARAPITQESKRQQADKLMQMQGQFQFNPPLITPEEWLQFQDFDMQDEIMKRMQQDRMKLEKEELDEKAGMTVQLAMQAAQMMMQGMSPEEVQAQIAQLYEQQKEEEPSGQQASAREQGAPEGTTDALAMQAMAQGM